MRWRMFYNQAGDGEPLAGTRGTASYHRPEVANKEPHALSRVECSHQPFVSMQHRDPDGRDAWN